MTESGDETALIRRAQKGDRAAFEALLRGYYDVMYRIAYRWSGNKSDAEDITQNACIKLARTIASFRFKSAFLSWLYPLVINTAKDWAKQQKSHAVASNGEWDPDRAVAPVAEDKVYARQVLDYVGRLPEKEREALCLVFGEGMSHQEVAVVMACKESTVSWYIHEARKKLQAFQSVGCGYG
jgi:RNA polymerase sigma-70 factor (ECF subfamily)